MTNISRRSLLCAAASAPLALAQSAKAGSAPQAQKPHFILVFDQNKCIGCGVCRDACVETNNLPAGQYRMVLERQSPIGALAGERKFVRVSCQQCQDPPCVRVCPTGAAHVDPATGVVTMNNDRCVGCKYCIAACPYNVRFINRVTRVAENCDFCLHTKLQKGEQPACVQACRHEALEFGNAADPNDFIVKLLAVKDSVRIRPFLGTNPNLHYIPQVKTGV